MDFTLTLRPLPLVPYGDASRGEGTYFHAQLVEGLDQIANRTLAHTRLAIEDIFSIAQGKEGAEKARRCPGVADEQFRFTGRDSASQADDRHFKFLFVQLDVETEGLQGFGKITRIIRKEGIRQPRLSVCQGGD